MSAANWQLQNSLCFFLHVTQRSSYPPGPQARHAGGVGWREGRGENVSPCALAKLALWLLLKVPPPAQLLVHVNKATLNTLRRKHTASCSTGVYNGDFTLAQRAHTYVQPLRPGQSCSPAAGF